MKRAIAPVGAAAVLLLAASFGTAALAGETVPGAYTAVPVTDEKVASAAAFAIDTKRKAMLAAGEPAALELVSIQRAEQQIVAGLNFRLELRVKWNGKEHAARAVVWWQAWRKPDPYRLTSWEWK